MTSLSNAYEAGRQAALNKFAAMLPGFMPGKVPTPASKGTTPLHVNMGGHKAAPAAPKPAWEPGVSALHDPNGLLGGR